MTKQSHDTSTETIDLDRRALLRRGGAAVVAGVAGVAAVQALTQSGAQAAAGAPAVLGAANDADATVTSITSSNADATLRLANTGAGAPLNLVSNPAGAPGSLGGGDLANFGGDLVYATTFGTGASAVTIPGAVYTTYNASQTVAITPQRALDTRNAAQRANIVGGTALEPSGRIPSGGTIEVDLGVYVSLGLGVFLNVTVTGASQAGFVTVYPGGTRPGTSTVNYGVNQIVANSAVLALSATDTISIYALRAVHVIIDVTAFTVETSADVTPSILPTGLQERRLKRAFKGMRASK